MKLTTLIPMTDFVNQIGNMENYPGHEKALSWIYNYANFLKQPLKIEMFVACNENGDVLNEPKDWKTYESGGSAFMNIDEILPCQDYKKAKEKVLFENVEVFTNWKYSLYYLQKIEFAKYNAKTNEFITNNLFDTVESIIALKPILTKNAIKQIQP